MAVLAMTNLHAQATYNDTVRTNTWSVYAQGGLTWWNGMRGADVSNTRQPFTPDIAVGVDYNIRPWVRVGLKAEYTMIKTSNKLGTKVVSDKSEVVDGYNVTTKIEEARAQDRNNMSVFGADLNVDFNIMDIWHQRKAQRFNLWLGTGVGFWHGWNRNSITIATREVTEKKNDTYYEIYHHDKVKSNGICSQNNALYIPVSLSAEYDITPRWTAGVFGEYKYLPMNKDLTPKHMVSFGVRLAYNFVGHKMKSYKKRYEEALAAQEILKECCSQKDALENELNDVNAENENLKKQLADARNDNRRLADEAKKAQAQKASGHVVYFDNDSDVITATEKSRLDDYLKTADGKQLSFIAEASKVGGAKYNQGLSERRLKAVLKYLQQKGFGKSSIKDAKAIGSINQGGASYRRVVIAE